MRTTPIMTPPISVGGPAMIMVGYYDQSVGQLIAPRKWGRMAVVSSDENSEPESAAPPTAAASQDHQRAILPSWAVATTSWYGKSPRRARYLVAAGIAVASGCVRTFRVSGGTTPVSPRPLFGQECGVPARNLRSQSGGRGFLTGPSRCQQRCGSKRCGRGVEPLQLPPSLVHSHAFTGRVHLQAPRWGGG